MWLLPVPAAERKRISVQSSSAINGAEEERGSDKTDRRDAVNLARLERAGELTAVHVPEPEDGR